jgi:hypothetical protein
MGAPRLQDPGKLAHHLQQARVALLQARAALLQVQPLWAAALPRA